MQNDVFNHDDSVVNDHANRGGESPEGHEIEALVKHFEGDKGDGDGHRNHQTRDDRCPPIAQKNYEDDGRENKSNQDGIAHTLDGIADDNGLIIKRLNVHALWECLADGFDFCMYAVGNLHSVAIGLTIDVE